MVMYLKKYIGVYTPAHVFRLIFSRGMRNLNTVPSAQEIKRMEGVAEFITQERKGKKKLTYSSQRIESHKNMFKASPFE